MPLLSFGDIFMAAILSFIIFLVIKWFQFKKKLRRRIHVKEGISIDINEYDRNQIERNCAKQFPKKTFWIKEKGLRIKRGMKLDIKATNNREFMGEFIGINDWGIYCIITPSEVFLDQIENIKTISIVK